MAVQDIPAEAVDQDAGASLAAQFSPPATKRLYPSLMISQLVIVGTVVAISALILPIFVTILSNGDPVLKVSNLAIVVTTSTLVMLFVQPIVGAFSDRTRSRMGRRAPWILIGGGISGAMLIGIGHVGSIASLTVAYVLVQIGLNAIQGPMAAIAPDRVPKARRGLVSAAIGLGAGLAGTAGITLASKLLPNVEKAFTTFGVLVLVATVLFVVVNPDYSSVGMEREPFSWGAFLRGFWVSPRKHPDFAWAFGVRFMYYVGYQAVAAYQLYILTDYIGLSQDDATAKTAVMALLFMITSVIAIPLAGTLSDKIGKRKVFIAVAAVIMVVGSAIPWIWPSLTSMFVLQALYGASFGLFISCDFALMTEVLPGDGVGAAKDLGILNLATMVPMAMASGAGALLINELGGYSTLFVFAMVAVAASAFMLIPIRGVK